MLQITHNICDVLKVVTRIFVQFKVRVVANPEAPGDSTTTTLISLSEQTRDHLRRSVGHSARLPVLAQVRAAQRGDAGRHPGREVRPDDQHVQQRDGEDREVLQEAVGQAADPEKLPRCVRKDCVGKVKKVPTRNSQMKNANRKKDQLEAYVET